MFKPEELFFYGNELFSTKLASHDLEFWGLSGVHKYFSETVVHRLGVWDWDSLGFLICFDVGVV